MRQSGGFKTSEKCLGPSITPLVFYKSYKNIFMLDRHSEASITSEKCLEPPATPGV